MPWFPTILLLSGLAHAAADDPWMPPACPVDLPGDSRHESSPQGLSHEDLLPDTLPWRWPRHVLLVGSSSMEHGFGPRLAEALEARGVERTTIRARYSTGLSRLDYFDWLEAGELLAVGQPDLVIMLFGGNDAQGLRRADGRREAGWGDPVWNGRYAARAERLMATFQARGAQVVVLGYPHPTREGYAGRIAEINATVRLAAQRVGAAYVSLWSRTSEADGAPRLTWDGPHGRRTLRQADGIHLAFGPDAGVADAVAETIHGLWGPTDTCPALEGPPPSRLIPIPTVEFPRPKPKDTDTDGSQGDDEDAPAPSP